MNEETSTLILEDEEDIITFNRLEKYIPIEFAILGYKNSWKKCRCGKIVPWHDNWCGGCGQKLGIPELEN